MAAAENCGDILPLSPEPPCAETVSDETTTARARFASVLPRPSCAEAKKGISRTAARMMSAASRPHVQEMMPKILSGLWTCIGFLFSTIRSSRPLLFSGDRSTYLISRLSPCPWQSLARRSWREMLEHLCNVLIYPLCVFVGVFPESIVRNSSPQQIV